MESKSQNETIIVYIVLSNHQNISSNTRVLCVFRSKEINAHFSSNIGVCWDGKLHKEPYTYENHVTIGTSSTVYEEGRYSDEEAKTKKFAEA